ncbi:MAG: hypothetical protein MZV64_48760 [Ignavibacteriales bacterium]|nr:hypothetical protein [Ignavibacteriales bacterium]
MVPLIYIVGLMIGLIISFMAVYLDRTIFGMILGFFKYIGTYVQAFGSLTTNEIGPARKWNELNFNLDNTGSLGYFTNYLFGKNSLTQTWDTLGINIPPSFSLNGFNPEQYPYVKMQFDLVDSTLGQSEPMINLNLCR